MSMLGPEISTAKNDKAAKKAIAQSKTPSMNRADFLNMVKAFPIAPSSPPIQVLGENG